MFLHKQVFVVLVLCCSSCGEGDIGEVSMIESCSIDAKPLRVENIRGHLSFKVDSVLIRDEDLRSQVERIVLSVVDEEVVNVDMDVILDNSSVVVNVLNKIDRRGLEMNELISLYRLFETAEDYVEMKYMWDRLAEDNYVDYKELDLEIVPKGVNVVPFLNYVMSNPIIGIADRLGAAYSLHKLGDNKGGRFVICAYRDSGYRKHEALIRQYWGYLDSGNIY